MPLTDEKLRAVINLLDSDPGTASNALGIITREAKARRVLVSDLMTSLAPPTVPEPPSPPPLEPDSIDVAIGQHALELAGAGCTAILTNTPHGSAEACAIVKNLIALVEEQHIEFVAALFRSIWGAEPGRFLLLASPVDRGKRRKSDARLRMVCLAEELSARPVAESSNWQGRVDRR
jgi:hypothetical protein